jgi:hypothetical protein
MRSLFNPAPIYVHQVQNSFARWIQSGNSEGKSSKVFTKKVYY